MRYGIILLAALAAGAAGCASNSTADRAAAGDQVASSGEKPRLICERVKKTGTRFTEKVCLTEEQWEAQRTASQEGGASATRDWQRRNSQAGGPLEGGH